MTRFLASSILRRILAALLSIYLATYFATALVVYSGVRASLLDSNAVALNQFADLKYRQLANVIGALATDLTAWSELDVMNDIVSGDLDQRVTRALEALKRQYGLSGEIYAFDETGRLIATSGGARGAGRVERIPPQWQIAQPGVALFDKAADPMSTGQVLALAIPIFGKFDPSYRVGTLVMTEPWPAIEAALFSFDNGTILLDRGHPGRILGADPAGIAERAGLAGSADSDLRPSAGFVVGHSVPQAGLIGSWEILVLQDIGTATRPLRRVALELLLLGGFLAVPIVILGRWLSRRLTAPIAALTRVVREIADTDKLDARVPVTSSDELGSLAGSFNRMTESLERTTQEREQFLRDLASLNQTLETKIAARTEELEAAVRAQRRLIGDISHEIKSPLARLSMALGLARRAAEAGRSKQFDRIEREVETISGLASELLTLAKLDGAASFPDFARVDLQALIERIVADAVFEHPDRAADVTLRLPAEPPAITGNEDLLRRAIENVVRNAMFYTVAGTRIDVALAAVAPTNVVIEIADCGPGVPETAVPHLFEPFYRVDEARARETGGTGIGLAICQRVVALHGGTVAATNNRPHGLILRIELPMAQPRP